MIIDLILLFLGSFISALAIQLVMIPLLVPIILGLHINPVHFGVMFSLNVMLGGVTPPFGMSMFITTKIAGVSVWDFAKEWCPLAIVLVVVLFLVTYIPSLVLWLPNLLIK